MIYLVTGVMRSGSSMMMKSLHEGGIPPIHSEQRDKRLNRKWSDKDYLPNAGGFYEMSVENSGLRWPQDYDEHAMKVLIRYVQHITPFAYKVIVMLRDPQEILSSYEGMTGQFNPALRAICKDYDQIMTNHIALLRNRRDVESVSLVNYPLTDKYETFSTLKAEGFPIDPIAAASVWHEELYRHRKGELATWD